LDFLPVKEPQDKSKSYSKKEGPGTNSYCRTAEGQETEEGQMKKIP
jgi:hypothetical protein